MIQAKIADMAVSIEAARLLTYKAAALKDAGKVALPGKWGWTSMRRN